MLNIESIANTPSNWIERVQLPLATTNHRVHKVKYSTDALCEAFLPVYDYWAKTLSSSSSIVNKTSGKNAYKILEEDIIQLGLFVLGADAIGARTERSALADVAATLRVHNMHSDHEKNLTYLSDKILTEISGIAAGSLALPLSIHIAKEAVENGKYSKNLADINLAFLAFADALILRDGNISRQELDNIAHIKTLFG